ncbi:MAG: histone deacetylase family protein [Pseudomonadota bacterium]
MKTVYSDAHRGHAGAKEMHLGKLVPIHEMPSRIDMILARLAESDHRELVAPKSFSFEALTRLHSVDYVTFLSEAWDLWSANSDAPYALPYTSVAPGMRLKVPETIDGKLSRYAFDLAAPFVAGTWDAIKASAEVALTGQEMVAGGEGAVFSLCRPPGHHAMADQSGGYCYLNNAAIAAQAFLDGGAGRVALVDVDYHHGNGSQSLFYDRDDVLFVSLHADPAQEYPHFLGYGDETGEGPGEGFNLNLPMAWGTAWDGYGAALDQGLARIADFGPDVVVISLGVDTFKEDPISRFKLEHEDYLRIGEAIAGLKRPTHFVMEGGYAVEAIGINTVNLLDGFAGSS